MSHRTTAELEPHLDHLAASPKDVGVLELLVCRPSKGTRRVLDEGVLDTEVGLVGDSWSTRRAKPPRPDKQVTLMNARMATLLSSDPPRQALCGDQLYVDLDLSVENLPAGTRIEVGDAVVEVSGCPARRLRDLRPPLRRGGDPVRQQQGGPTAAAARGQRAGRDRRHRRPGDKVVVHRPDPALVTWAC